jgi:hypothetical protein
MSLRLLRNLSFNDSFDSRAFGPRPRSSLNIPVGSYKNEFPSMTYEAV